MSIFGRRRNFDRPLGPNDRQPDLTGYDEKQVFSTDGLFGGAPVQQPVVQPVVQPTVDYTSFAQSGAANYGAVATEMREIPAPEKPMVFAMRGHSDIYIYEYSDRLEYYVKASTKMHLFDTVYKNR